MYFTPWVLRPLLRRRVSSRAATSGCRGASLPVKALPYGSKELFGFNPFRGVHSIVGAPIAKQPSGCSQHTGQGVSAQAEQLAEQMSAYTLAHLLGAKPLALVQEFFDALEEMRRVFFTVSGEGGASGRSRTSVERS